MKNVKNIIIYIHTAIIFVIVNDHNTMKASYNVDDKYVINFYYITLTCI